MKTFFYSAKPCFTQCFDKAFMATKNLTLIEHNKNEVFKFNLGANFEQSLFCYSPFFKQNVAITDLYGYLLCYPLFKPCQNYPYEKIYATQIVVNNFEYEVTVFTDKTPKLKCKGYDEVYIDLPFIPTKINIFKASDLIFADLYDKMHFIAVIRTPDLSVQLKDICDQYQINNTLSVTKIYHLTGTHKKTRHYSYDGSVKYEHTSFVSQYSKDLPLSLIPLAFLEEVRLSVDYRHFLCDDLVNDYLLIKDFLGDYELIIPPFFETFKNTFALVGKTVNYVNFIMDGDKIKEIANLSP